MQITNLILFTMSVIGLTHILVDSDMPLIEWGRQKIKSGLNSFGDKWKKILDCYQCCGTWCGFICGTILLTHTVYANSILNIIYNILIILISGFAGGFLGQWSATYLNYLEAQTLISIGQEEKEDK